MTSCLLYSLQPCIYISVAWLAGNTLAEHLFVGELSIMWSVEQDNYSEAVWTAAVNTVCCYGMAALYANWVHLLLANGHVCRLFPVPAHFVIDDRKLYVAELNLQEPRSSAWVQLHETIARCPGVFSWKNNYEKYGKGFENQMYPYSIILLSKHQSILAMNRRFEYNVIIYVFYSGFFFCPVVPRDIWTRTHARTARIKTCIKVTINISFFAHNLRFTYLCITYRNEQSIFFEICYLIIIIFR